MLSHRFFGKNMKSIVKDKTLYRGRPADAYGRTAREMAVYDMLDSLGVEYMRLDHDIAPTIEACAEIDGIMQTDMCKNLFLCNGGKTQFYLLLLPGEKRFSTKEFSHAIGCSRLSFAPAEFMESLLGVTPGSVTVLSLMNDKENRVRLFIDEDVLKSEYIGCHPCINTSSLKIRMSDLTEKILPHMKHGFETVALTGGEIK